MSTTSLEQRLALRTDEVAELLGVSVRTVRKLIEEGQLPAIRPHGKGGLLLISRDDVLAWLRRHQSLATSQQS